MPPLCTSPPLYGEEIVVFERVGQQHRVQGTQKKTLVESSRLSRYSYTATSRGAHKLPQGLQPLPQLPLPTQHFPLSPLIPYTSPHSRRRRRHETTADDLLQRRPALLPVRVRAADGPRGRLDSRRRVRGNVRRHLHLRRRSWRRPVLPVKGGAALPGRYSKVRVRAVLPRLEQHAEPHRPRPRPANRAHRPGAR